MNRNHMPSQTCYQSRLNIHLFVKMDKNKKILVSKMNNNIRYAFPFYLNSEGLMILVG